MRAILLHPYLLVAIGGATGSICRYALNKLIEGLMGPEFPFGTMSINIIGSFFIGLVAGLTKDAMIWQLIIAGLLGGFTTFSSFSLQSVNLIQNGRPVAASLYIIGSVGLCLLGTLVGLLLAGWLVAPRPA